MSSPNSAHQGDSQAFHTQLESTSSESGPLRRGDRQAELYRMVTDGWPAV
jgi:hypothetical protein